MDRSKFPGYLPGKRNRVIIAIQDICFAGTDRPTEELPSKEKANEFMEKLIKFCQQNKFEVFQFGSKEVMMERFHRESKSRQLYTEQEMLEFAYKFSSNDTPPTKQDLLAWKLNRK